ncbi:MAG TPA: glutamine ABC transporter ATP-binding protein GlnQ, partial [Thermoanaerobacterales bacterium]|nr:glutamine ABC transporter ATP-binding protein GlnQ [Thermoanaerobacterales bacterium]
MSEEILKVEKLYFKYNNTDILKDINFSLEVG